MTNMQINEKLKELISISIGIAGIVIGIGFIIARISYEFKLFTIVMSW